MMYFLDLGPTYLSIDHKILYDVESQTCIRINIDLSLLNAIS